MQEADPYFQSPTDLAIRIVSLYLPMRERTQEVLPHVKEPLGIFQRTKSEKDDTRKLVHTINRALGIETSNLPCLR